MAPPNSSAVTSSAVTDLMTAGPVRNISDVFLTMKTKSIRAGLYTAPPAQGPMMTAICGMTPDAAVLFMKMRPKPDKASTPSWMRAPRSH